MKKASFLLVLHLACSSPRLFAQATSESSLEVMGGVVTFAETSTPLRQAFEAYHQQSILDLISAVNAAARAKKPDIILSGNLAGGFHQGRWPEAAQLFDYLNTEMDVIGAMKHPGHFLSIAALTEAAGTVNMVMPNSSSNGQWSRKEDPRAYAFGTGLAYAMGAHMHVPWCLYDGSQFNRFYGSLEGHQPIFKMIHEHRDCLDGYVSALWHLLKVPYGQTGFSDRKALESHVERLFKAGIPALIRFEGSTADFGGPRLFGEARTEQLFCGAETPLPDTAPVKLVNDSSENPVMQHIRVSSEESTTPMVIHLLQPARAPGASSATLRIHPHWLPASRIDSVEVVAIDWPGKPKATTSWKQQADGALQIEVENISGWAILRIHTTEKIQLPGAERPAFRAHLAESEIPLMRMIRFDTRWNRPEWVDNALAETVDPLDGYHLNRITWSYDHSLKTCAYAKEHNIAFHGSDSYLHAYMTPGGSPIDNQTEIFTRPADWDGWARYANGQPMHIRPDWNPPRYGASFASESYRAGMIQRAAHWIDQGASGIQFDDVSGMVNRVWRYGGDFSDHFFTGFRRALSEQELCGVTLETPLPALRTRVVKEAHRGSTFKRNSDGTLSVSKQTGYPGLLWIGPKDLACAKGTLSVDYELRFTASPHAELLLMDPDRTMYASRLKIENNLPLNQWIHLLVEYNLQTQTARFKTDTADSWSAPQAFDIPLPESAEQVTATLMVNPKKSGLQIKSITTTNNSERPQR